MLRILTEQEEALQAQLDEPIVDDYCRALGPDAAELGIDPGDLRVRVASGLRLARKADARDGFERNAFVALAVFVSSTFTELPGYKLVLGDRRMSLEAKLRFLTTLLVHGPRQES